MVFQETKNNLIFHRGVCRARREKRLKTKIEMIFLNLTTFQVYHERITWLLLKNLYALRVLCGELDFYEAYNAG